MTCKNFFNRYCLENDIAIASSNALSSNKFHNEPEKIVMVYELLTASIERLNQACERMGLTVSDAIARYEKTRLQHARIRSALVGRQKQQRKQIVQATAGHRCKASGAVHIVG